MSRVFGRVAEWWHGLTHFHRTVSYQDWRACWDCDWEYGTRPTAIEILARGVPPTEGHPK